MSDAMNVPELADTRETELIRAFEKIYQAARPGAAFGEPVTSGNYTVVTASEISAGGGFGSGSGISTTEGSAEQQGGSSGAQARPVNRGGGMGGGGGSSARPVAVIIIGPEGVHVKPVVDVTKIVLAGVTAWGAMLMMLRKMRRGGRR